MSSSFDLRKPKQEDIVYSLMTEVVELLFVRDEAHNCRTLVAVR